jgi:hypothetical protein
MKNPNMKFKKIAAIFMGFLSFANSYAQDASDEKTVLTFYGFGRTNFVWDNRDLGQNDLFIPANIDVNAPRVPNFFIGAKQTRIGFDVKHTLNEEVLSIKIEGDFHNNSSNTNGIFRMRHAYANYKFVLVGMFWSNFFDADVNPVSVDFEGPNSSTLSRTPQIRFSTYRTKNVLSISFENPLEELSVGGNITVLPERFPDVIGAYRINRDFGFIKAAALFRELRYQSDKARSVMSYGATVMGSINAGDRDKLKFQGVMGTGIARYIEGARGLNYDAVYNGTNELEALQMYGANLSFQHFWDDHMHSSLTGGLLSVEKNENIELNDYKSGYYGSANLFWDATKNLTFGWEVVVGERVNVNEEKGTGVRTQMNATYKFSKSFN